MLFGVLPPEVDDELGVGEHGAFAAQRVEFTIGQGAKGPQATGVRVI